MKWKLKAEPYTVVDAFKAGDRDIPNFVEDALKRAPRGFYVVTELGVGKPGFEMTSAYNPTVFEADYECLEQKAYTAKPQRPD